MSTDSNLRRQHQLLLCIFEEAYKKRTWHGPNLRGSIRSVSAAQATRRAGRSRYNIAEITVHCAYWKYTLRRRIRGEKRGSFTLKGSNWFKLPTPLTDAQWRKYVALLDGEHKALRETLTETPWPKMLRAFPSESKLTEHIYGVAMHDTYHAGQIQLLKALIKRSTSAK